MNTLTFRLSFTGKQFFQPNYKVCLSNRITYNSHGTAVSQKHHSNKIKDASETTTISKQTQPQLQSEGRTPIAVDKVCTDAEDILLWNKISVKRGVHNLYSCYNSTSGQEPETGPHCIKLPVFRPGTSDLQLC